MDQVKLTRLLNRYPFLKNYEVDEACTGIIVKELNKRSLYLIPRTLEFENLGLEINNIETVDVFSDGKLHHNICKQKRHIGETKDRNHEITEGETIIEALVRKSLYPDYVVTMSSKCAVENNITIERYSLTVYLANTINAILVMEKEGIHRKKIQKDEPCRSLLTIGNITDEGLELIHTYKDNVDIKYLRYIDHRFFITTDESCLIYEEDMDTNAYLLILKFLGNGSTYFDATGNGLEKINSFIQQHNILRYEKRV